jgi:glycosyltransferase involved in cell wall biosynthesis
VSEPTLVSCIVPVFNGETFLAEAIESVLAQTYAPIEIIVVDDGSTDGTPGVIASFGARIKSLHQANAGPSAARNRGIREARGTYLAFLDADDLWVAAKTATQLRHLAGSPDLDVSTSLMQNFWMDELADEAARMRNTELARPQPGPSQTLLARKVAFGRVGLFDPALHHRDTQDWMIRARSVGVRFGQLNEVLVHRRLHASNLSRSRGAEDTENLFAILAKKLAAQSRPTGD